MEPPVVPDGAVEQAGAGNRAVSLNDVERERRASVLAYCARLCDPERIAEAADAAFADLRAALEAAPQDGVVDLERVLLEATRDAAASRTSARGSLSGMVTRRPSRTCEVMPTLLAGRASGRLSANDLQGVDRHLARCAACRDLERRRSEAEQAYGALLGTLVAPAAPDEPFAPGDPRPEVAARRDYTPRSSPLVIEDFAWEDGASEDLAWEGDDTVAREAVEEPGPEAVAEEAFPAVEGDDEQPEAVADDEQPEAEVVAPQPVDDDSLDAEEDEEPVAARPTPDTEEFTAQDVADAEGDAEPRLAFEGWSSPAERDEGPGRRGRAVIAAVIAAGVVFLAIGLFQLLGDDSGSSSRTSQSQPAAHKPAAPAPTAAPGPSRAELRIRARLRAMGDRELSQGTLGDDVKALQRLLGVQQTGTFGQLTTAAVSQFQTSHGLPATGVANEATKRKLARRTKPPKIAPAPPAASTTTPPATGSGTTPPANSGTTPPPSTGTTAPAQPAQPGQ
jgi:peptidoglycan hydrolase-like protein with peptidoglycan-binding domain